MTAADGGVGTYDEIEVTTNDTDAAEITDINDATGAGNDAKNVAGDGSSATIAAQFGGDTADTGTVTIATVEVEAGSGVADLGLSVNGDIFDEAGSIYTVGSVNGATLDASGTGDDGGVEAPTSTYAETISPTFTSYDGLTGQALWVGQEITVEDSDLSSGDEVQLRERIDDSTTRLRQQITADAGSVTFDTDDRTEGDYYLYTPDADFGVQNQSDGTNIDNTFGLTEQSLTAAFDESSVTEEGPNSVTDFEFDSNRGTYPVNVSADGDLSADDLTQIFDGDFDVADSNVNGDDDEIVLRGVTDDDEYELDFTGIDTGEYEFTFEGTDSTAEDTDSIEVTESNQEAEFDQSATATPAGDIAEFTITLEDTSDTYVQIGGESSDFVDVLYIEEDDDEPVTIQINTRLLGSNAPIDDVYDTDNTATFESEVHGGIDTHPDNIALYEDDGQAVGNNFDDYVDNIGIADSGSGQLARPLQSTDYEIAAAGTVDVDDAVFDADPGGEANNQLGSKVMTLTQPQLGDITTHTAPEESADDTSDVEELVSEATAREEIAVEDRLIVQVEATGIYGAMVAGPEADGSLNTDFDRLSDGASTQVLNRIVNNVNEGISFEVTGESATGNQDPLEVDLTAGDSETYVVLDEENGQFFLVADTSSDDAFANGDAPDSATSFTADIEYTADEEDDRFEFADQDDPAPFGPSAGSAGNYPYLLQGEVVDSSSELELAPRSIEYDNVNEDDQVELTNTEGAELSASTNVAPGSDAEIRVSSTDASQSFRQGNDINISEDGSVTTTFDLSDQETGDEFDANFRVGGSSVDTTSGVIVESMGDMDDGETNETDDGEDMDDGEEEPSDDGDMNETDDSEADDGSTDDGTPGFGAVVALVALIGAALLATRRQN